MREVSWEADLCVVGGGLTGLSVSLSAARHGARVVLVHDRPIWGGNASSEIRVAPGGACRSGGLPHVRETGIIEEIRLRSVAENPEMEWTLWDLMLYDLVVSEPNLTGLMNASCLEAELQGERIASVRAWQLTTETWHTVRAPIFVDCSGDGLLGALSGADYRIGREAQAEYGEPTGREVADARTMGMTIEHYARREDHPVPFRPPAWAYSYPREEDIPFGAGGHGDVVEREGRLYRTGFWWVELGGEADSIHDTEALKHELLRISLGVWDHIKNHGDHDAENYQLVWLGFMPGKRESRRLLGDYVLREQDCAQAPIFPDTVGYGGWPMDDHNPRGFYEKTQTNINHQAASPYNLPYRCLYSRNVENLMMAGRNISATHLALSSTRVMATCSVLGQAVGLAATLAASRGLTPRAVGQECLDELQQTLMADDCWLPGFRLRMPEVNRHFRLTSSAGDAAVLHSGVDRRVGEELNCLTLPAGGWVALEAESAQRVEHVDVVLDSDLSTSIITMQWGCDHAGHRHLPATLARRLRLWLLGPGGWEPWVQVEDNCRRHLRFPLNRAVRGVRLEGLEGGAPGEPVNLFRFNLA